MGYNPISIYRGQPGVVEASVYSTPVGKTTIIKDMIITNVSDIEGYFTMSVVPSGSGPNATNRIASQVLIPAKTFLHLECASVMSEGDYITVKSEVTGTLTVHLSGVEVSD